MIACHAENQCSSVASAVCLNARSQVPMFTASGLQVRFLKIIEKSNYQTARAPVPTPVMVFACSPSPC
jgi:hypothetical protein